MIENIIKERKRILFVDDDEKLLQGLRRGLRSMRDQWELYFVSCAQEALDLFKEHSIDIIIADVKMPKIDGFTLLKQVKSEFPHTMRVVLSGETGEDIGHKALEVANQCLVKPCGVEELKSIFVEMLEMQKRLGQGILKDAVTRLDNLPSLPQQYWDLKDAIDDPNSNMQGISDVISKDIAMTAKILQLANSAFFGFSIEKITSLSRAVTMLGLELVGKLAMVTHVFSAYDSNICPQFSIDRLWSDSLRVSHLARKIVMAEKASKDVVEQALMGGMLHAIGRLVFATCVPRDYNKFLVEKKEGEKMSIEKELIKERVVFGTTHPDVGAFMVGMWGLPKVIVDVVGNHRNPEKCISERGMTAPLAVAAATAIADNDLDGTVGERLRKAATLSNLRGHLDRWILLDDANSKPQEEQDF